MRGRANPPSRSPDLEEPVRISDGHEEQWRADGRSQGEQLRRRESRDGGGGGGSGGPNDGMEQQPEEEEWEFPFMCHNCSGWGHVRASGDCPSKKKQAGGMKTAVFGDWTGVSGGSQELGDGSKKRVDTLIELNQSCL